MTRFSPKAEEILRRAGWYPGRHVPDLVALWRADRMLSKGFEMSRSAEIVLLEFGGLSINEKGLGETCAREPFTFDPTLAAYESDRFAEFMTLLTIRLYPLGEAVEGHYFFAVGDNDHVYLLMEDIMLLGKSVEEGLEALLIGREPKEVTF